MNPQVKIFNWEGKETGAISADVKVFDGVVHQAAVYQAVVATQGNLRQGNAATKTRGNVSGGGKKPWKQKHTGRARAGSNRSPLWRKGGIIFGPHPRDYTSTPPKKVRRLAVRSCLNDKLAAGKLRALEIAEPAPAKTKALAQALERLGCLDNCLLVLEKPSESLRRASRNLPGVRILTADSICAEDLLRAREVLVTPQALSRLSQLVVGG